MIPTNSRPGDPPNTFRIKDGEQLYEWCYISPKCVSAHFRKYDPSAERPIL